MTRWLATFGGERKRHVRLPMLRDFEAEARKLAASGERFGLRCIVRDPAWLKSGEFYEKNQRMLDLPHYGWLFKPAVIWDALSSAEDGDVVLWSDSNHVLTMDPQRVFELARNNGGVFCHRHQHNEYPNRDWTKRDTFVLMGCDEPAFHNEPQTQVNFMAFWRRDDALDFVREWLRLCCDPLIMTDAPNTCGSPNLPGFQEHRWEQSVFSLLRQLRGVKMFDDPLDLYFEYYEGAPC